jgi:hypothetical protein
MNKKDKLLIKHKDTTVQEMVYIASTQTQYLFSKESDLVGIEEKAILWAGDIGTTRFLPIKKKHNFIQLNETTWELNVDIIEKDDL